jgi:hypothetical protein
MPKSKNLERQTNKTEMETPFAHRPSANRLAGPPAGAPAEFTIAEHLRVQREIEKRAHRFWFAKGCALNTALNDWLKAEAQVLAEFVKSRPPRQAVSPVAGGTQTRNGGTPAFPPAAFIRPQKSLSLLGK